MILSARFLFAGFRSLTAALLLLLATTQVSLAQQPREDGFYSPDDWHKASLAQRVATGHAGFYRNCDDDAAKRYSPYIEWTCKPRSWNAFPPGLTLSTIPADLQRKTDRHLAGQGACAPACTRTPPSPLNLLRLPPELIRIPSYRAE